MESRSTPISAAIFVPQTRQPSKDDLDRLKSRLTQDARCENLLRSIRQLPHTYELICREKPEVGLLEHALTFATSLSGWLDGSVSWEAIADARAVTHSLALLLLIQCTQVFDYLDAADITYADMMSQIRGAGGVQGNCGGIPAAMVIACSESLEHAVDLACIALHVSFCVGLVAELDDNITSEGISSIILRLQHEGQSDELVEMFPKIHIAAVNDPRSVIINGAPDSLIKLLEYVKQSGLQVQVSPIRGKTHNPENHSLADDLNDICRKHKHLTLPSARDLQAPLRCNRTGSRLVAGSLTRALIKSILTDRCEWFSVVRNIAEDMAASSRPAHLVLSFGLGESLTLSPFHERRLKVTKIEMQSFLSQHAPIQPSQDPMPDHAVAIIGLACRFPGANDFDQLWSLISNGIDTHRELSVDRFDLPGSSRAQQSASFMRGRKFWGNFLDDIKSVDRQFFGYNPTEVLHMDPQQRLLLELAYEALESGGLSGGRGSSIGSSVGCFIGAGYVDYNDNTSCYPTTAYTSTGTLRAFLAGRLSHKFGWHGPCEVIDTACSSSLVAINRAYNSIKDGECDIAVSGGVSMMTSVNTHLDLARVGFLSPTGQCKPFDYRADGYCRSEGGGLVILKPYAKAIEDGDLVYGVIRGTAVNHGSAVESIVAPDSQHQAGLYRRVLHKAGMEPRDISYIEAHGTGTETGDLVEMSGIRTIFAHPERPSALSVGSIKANIGHAETAAGIAGLLKAVAMLQNKGIPPMAGFKSLNPKIPPLESDRITIDSQLRSWDVPQRAIVVNSFGAAGSNASAVCSEPPQSTTTNADDAPTDDVYPFILSAQSPSSLQSYAERLTKYLSEVRHAPKRENISFTLSERRKRFKHRMIGTASATQDIVGEMRPYETSSTDRPVIFCFSGQGSDIFPLSLRLLQAFPFLDGFIKKCDKILKNMNFPSILSAIFQPQSEMDIVTYQTSLVVIQIGFARCWVASGLRVDGIIGHSLGEIAALGFSEALSIDDCLRLVATRASLIEKLWSKDKGSMLAVHADERLVRNIISDVASALPDSTIEIACYNSETSQVIAGNSRSIDLAAEIIRTRYEVKFQRLNTSHAYHSALTKPILHDLEATVSSLDWKSPKYRLEPCTEKPTEITTTYSLLEHTRKPVYFGKAVGRLDEMTGPALWIEAGANGQIVPMIKRVLNTPADHSFLQLVMTSDTNPSKLLSTAVADLWKIGSDVTPWQFSTHSDSRQKMVWLPPYQFDRSEYWLKNVDHARAQPEKMMTEDIIAVPLKIVTPLTSLTKSDTYHDFKVNTTLDRFQTLIQGHAIRGQPLCPASLYLECCSVALETLSREIQESEITSPKFEEVMFMSPLGSDTTRTVQLRLAIKSASDHTYKFTLSSYPQGGDTKDRTIHCEGLVSPHSGEIRNVSTRLLSLAMKEFAHRKSLERLTRKKAYKLFAQVVEYEHFFRGIDEITLGASEAQAKISIPDSKVYPAEDVAIDAVTADCLVQVAGLLANSSDDIEDGELLLATGFDRVEFANNRSREWTVFAQVSLSRETSEFIGDLYAFAPDGSLAAVFEGCRFALTSTELLGRVLSTSKAPSVIVEEPARTTRPRVSAKDFSIQIPDHSTQTRMESPSVPVEQDLSPIETEKNGDTELLTQILATHLGISMAALEDLDHNITLGVLGLDSLAAVQLAGELIPCGITCEGPWLKEKSIGDLKQIVAPTTASSVGSASVNTASTPQTSSSIETTPTVTSMETPPTLTDASPKDQKGVSEDIILEDIVQKSKQRFDVLASEYGFADFWSFVEPDLALLSVKYIVDAFGRLGCPLSRLSAGGPVEQIRHLPQHSQVVQRIYGILQKHDILRETDSGWARGIAAVPEGTIEDISSMILRRHPQYSVDVKVMALTGPKLAKCLIGEADPVALLFGAPQGRESLTSFYRSSPMLATLTDQLLAFTMNLIEIKQPAARRLRILEVGAGTGGTTAKLAPMLQNDISGPPPELYTFSDISSTLTRQAKSEFGSQFDWMEYRVFDLEQNRTPDDMRDKYDIVIATNCVHATKSRIGSLQRIFETLKENGVVILSEQTRVIDWYDIVFGLLDGWWRSGGGHGYPIRTASQWEQDFQDAGFTQFECTGGVGLESTSQQLLIGTKSQPQSKASTTAKSPAPSNGGNGLFESITLDYAQVDGEAIQADVYIPRRQPAEPMPICILIHGGGFVTLSRKSVRHSQSAHLIANGVVTVSIDYRLCPGVSIADGPMADVRSAYVWVVDRLPEILAARGVRVDPSKIGVVGWSTGGHLAMTLGWTLRAIGYAEPKVIMPIGSPVDFERYNSEVILPDKLKTWKPSLPFEEVLKTIPKTPITSYYGSNLPEPANLQDDSLTDLACFYQDDPRADLIAYMFQTPRISQPLLLHGMDGYAALKDDEATWARTLARISPLAWLRSGDYRVPTVLLHGTEDEIAPFEGAERFDAEMRRRKIPGGLRRVEGANHSFDVRLSNHDREWGEVVVPAYGEFLGLLRG